MEYTEELDDLFKSIGFMNFKEFVKTATSCTSLDSHEPLSENAILLDDLYSDSDEIGYIFIIDKNEKTEKWYIHSISAAVQLNTIRNIEGVILVGKEYHRCNAPIPTKEEIRKEVMQMVRIEKVKEKFHLNEKGRHPSLKNLNR